MLRDTLAERAPRVMHAELWLVTVKHLRCCSDALSERRVVRDA